MKQVSSTSGRSEKEEEEGRSPRDLADLTELRNFSPTLEKSMPPQRRLDGRWEQDRLHLIPRSSSVDRNGKALSRFLKLRSRRGDEEDLERSEEVEI